MTTKTVEILEVQIKNIKTFSDVTVRDFSPNVNAIVGMNGTGKSNFFCALKFALTKSFYPASRYCEVVERKPRGDGVNPSVTVKLRVIDEAGKEKILTISRVIVSQNRDVVYLNEQRLPSIDVLGAHLLQVGIPFFSSSLFVFSQADVFLAASRGKDLLSRVDSVVRSQSFLNDCSDIFNASKEISKLESKAKESYKAAKNLIEHLLSKLESNQLRLLTRDVTALCGAIDMKELKQSELLVEEFQKLHSADLESLERDLQTAKNDFDEAEMYAKDAAGKCEKSRQLVVETRETCEKLELLIRSVHKDMLEKRTELAVIENALIDFTFLSGSDLASDSSSIQRELSERQDLLQKYREEISHVVRTLANAGVDSINSQFVYTPPSSPSWKSNIQSHVSKLRALLSYRQTTSSKLSTELDDLKEKISQLQKELDDIRDECERVIAENKEAMQICKARRKEISDVDARRNLKYSECTALERDASLASQEVDKLKKAFSKRAGMATVAGFASMQRLIKSLTRSNNPNDRQLAREYRGVTVDLLKVDDSLGAGVAAVAGRQLYSHVVSTRRFGMALAKRFDEMNLDGTVAFLSLDNDEQQGRDRIPSDADLAQVSRNIKKLSPMIEGPRELVDAIFGNVILCKEIDDMERLAKTKAPWVKNAVWATVNGTIYKPRQAMLYPTAKSTRNVFQLRKALTEQEKIAAEAHDAIDSIKNQLTSDANELDRLTKDLYSAEDVVRATDEEASKLRKQCSEIEQDLTQSKKRHWKKNCSWQESQTSLLLDSILVASLTEAADHPENANLTEAQHAELKDEYARLANLIIESTTELVCILTSIFQQEIGKRGDSNSADKARQEREQLREKQRSAKTSAAETSEKHETLKAEFATATESWRSAEAAFAALEKDKWETQDAVVAASAKLLALQEQRDRLRELDELEAQRAKCDKAVIIFIKTYQDDSGMIKDATQLAKRSLKSLNEEMSKLKSKKRRMEERIASFTDAQKEAQEEQQKTLEKAKKRLKFFKRELETCFKEVDVIVGVAEELIKRWNPQLEQFGKRWVEEFHNIFLLAHAGGNFDAELRVDISSAQHGIFALNGVFLDVTLAGHEDPLQSLNELSNGQKSLLTFCLVTSLYVAQNIPICCMDEIDQSLDVMTHRKAVAKAVKELSDRLQFFVTTFGNEFVEVADQRFLVSSPLSRTSTVMPVSKDVALECIREAQVLHQ